MSPRACECTVLFDGGCNLCNASVRFIIRHDRAARFSFASLESAFAAQFHEAKFAKSLLLIEGTHVYAKSTAVLRIARRLDGLWRIVYVFMVVPKPLRDFAYDYVAKHRYKIFGHSQECVVPSPDHASRFRG